MFSSFSVWKPVGVLISCLVFCGRLVNNLEISERARQGYQHRLLADIFRYIREYFWKNSLRYDCESNVPILGNSKNFVSSPRWFKAWQLFVLHDRFTISPVRYIKNPSVDLQQRFGALYSERRTANSNN